MAAQSNPRVTIDKVDSTRPLAEWKPLLADFGRRRHLCYTMDFDTRALLLKEHSDSGDDEARGHHTEIQKRLRDSLAKEYGSDQLEKKIENFVAIGTKPFSILAYHNQFFEQTRRSFVIGAYYPALLSACSLGERILNHLILDLREFYKKTKQYKIVSRKASFDNWQIAIDVLEAWHILLPEVIVEFNALRLLRNRSIHFNAATYANLRDDALAAIYHIREIIDQQFTAFGKRPWFIEGTKGHIFIKRKWEENPFVRTYYLPTCPFVGPYFAILFDGGLQFVDHADYGDGDWTDEEFAAVFEARSSEQLANAS